MSSGAFRDAGSAAIERVAILEQEKADLEAELEKLRGELRDHGQRDALPTELARLKVQLAAERADLKEALTELSPLARKLEAAERAFHQAKDDQRLASEEAAKATGQLEIMRGELTAGRDQIRDLRAEVRNAKADTSARVEVQTKVPENLDAYMQRVQQERDDLREEVRVLKEASSKTPRTSLLGVLFGRR